MLNSRCAKNNIVFYQLESMCCEITSDLHTSWEFKGQFSKNQVTALPIKIAILPLTWEYRNWKLVPHSGNKVD